MFRLMVSSVVVGLISLFCSAQSGADQPQSPPAAENSAKSTQPALAPNPSTTSVGGPAAPNVVYATPLSEANALYRKGDFDGALAKYQAILQAKSTSPDAYAGIIHVYLKQKKVDQAAETAERALTLSDSPRIRVAHAEVLFRQGHLEDAEKEWVGVINSGYPEARAYLGLARIRRALAMYKSSVNFINKAHEIDSQDPDIQRSWISTLPRAERIKYLQDALAGENNWDADQRSGTAEYLEYLKERAKRNVPPCRLASHTTSTETPLLRLMFDPQHMRGYGLAVMVNGHKNSLMLDTGAGGIVVKRSIAEKAGISKISATKIGGVGDKGWKNAYVGVADSIKIGDLEFQNCPIEVMEGRSVADEDGLIGANVFDDFLVDIDFPDEKLKLTQLPRRPGEPEQTPSLKNEEDDDSEPAGGSSDSDSKAPPVSHGPQDRYIAPEMQSYTHIFLFGHDVLVPTRIGDVPPKLFLLDTGALTNSISPVAAREVTKVGRDPDMQIKGVSGSVNNVFSANKALLQFGRLRQENQEMISFDTTSLSDNAGTEISGFLGFTTLRFLDIKIDYRDALIDFTYDRSRWHF